MWPLFVVFLFLVPSVAQAQSQVCMTLPVAAVIPFGEVRDYENARGKRNMTDGDFVNNIVRSHYRAMLAEIAARSGQQVDNSEMSAIPELAKQPICGDAITNGAEECDSAGESAACDRDCTSVSCGDGYTNITAGEECDGGVGCNPDCTLQ